MNRKRSEKYDGRAKALLIALVALVSIIIIASVRPENRPESTVLLQVGSIDNITNALYGLPNQSMYTVYYHYIPITSGTSVLPGSVVIYSDAKSYGLNFTGPLILGPSEPPPSYQLQLPPEFSNISYPVVVNINVYIFSNATGAFNDFHKLFGEKALLSILEKNISYGNYTYTATYVADPGIGGNSSIVTIVPLYHTLEFSQAAFQYGRYVIIVPIYGVLNHYNINYTKEIASHIYLELSRTGT